jgi:hypothetical protein
MNPLDQFRDSLEQTCRIARWSPSKGELKEIARRIAVTQAMSLEKAASVVIAVCPDTLFSVMEGVDNSDLRTLLALATTAATQG